MNRGPDHLNGRLDVVRAMPASPASPDCPGGPLVARVRGDRPCSEQLAMVFAVLT
ncbi:hypothetical protein [Streptomyces hayashii]|uniref:hypothetical protein n=1 Tax=Streptomyces hayashii TaxID=2839966 RepID=UPI00403C7E94